MNYDFDIMIEVLGENYYIDIERVQEIISIEDKTSGDSEQNISLVKFELVKTMIDVIMSENEEVDSNLGAVSLKDISIPFKIAFNTLLYHKILKRI